MVYFIADIDEDRQSRVYLWFNVNGWSQGNIFADGCSQGNIFDRITFDLINKFSQYKPHHSFTNPILLISD